MSLAVVHSRSNAPGQANPVIIEAHLSRGLPAFNIVGLPEKTVRESKERVRSAIINTALDFPCRRITINMAPADVPKQGGCFDLPIALGVLVASQQLKQSALDDYEFVGELALSGTLLPLKNSLSVAIANLQAKRKLILPTDSAVGLSDNSDILCIQHLSDLLAFFAKKSALSPPQIEPDMVKTAPVDAPTISDIIGQAHAKRALTIAAAGGHNLLMVGPPGSGKSMLAHSLCSLLPALDRQQAREVAILYEQHHTARRATTWKAAPFRSPHHTCTLPALIGGGNPIQPGEITLAHHGVLFLDELPEFSRASIEALREPLENRCIHLSRANQKIRFHANFLLVAAMNPCPCGYYGTPGMLCRCSATTLSRYQHKLSGPFLDRMDLFATTTRPNADEAMLSISCQHSDQHAHLCTQIYQARKRQQSRQGCLNSELSGKKLAGICTLNASLLQQIKQSLTSLHLSLRSTHRLIRVTRTIADLEGCTAMTEEHFLQALQLRQPAEPLSTH